MDSTENSTVLPAQSRLVLLTDTAEDGIDRFNELLTKHNCCKNLEDFGEIIIGVDSAEIRRIHSCNIENISHDKLCQLFISIPWKYPYAAMLFYKQLDDSGFKIISTLDEFRYNER